MKGIIVALFAVILSVTAYEVNPVQENFFLPFCRWEKLPLGFYGHWTREPSDPARPLEITWEEAADQPGFTKYILNRAGTTKTYYVKFDANWRDERRWFTLDPTKILLEKRINGQYYEERMSLESPTIYRIVGQDETQTFNITLKRVL